MNEDTTLFNISPKELTAILSEAATKDRTVVEFQRREREDGTKELYQAIEITEHVETLESQNE